MHAKQPVIEVRNVWKSFEALHALTDISLAAHAGEVTCLLGDNGAGKSTLIKILSGTHVPSRGRVFVEGSSVDLDSPRHARALGIATVHQTGGTIPLMSLARNFFLGAEPTKGWGPFRRFDAKFADDVALEEIAAIGLTRARNANQAVALLSGGERQALTIARAMYFGARVLILDEPTSALGVKEAGIVLRMISRARQRGVAVILVTHNVHHALSVGDSYYVLIHGSVAAHFRRGEKTREEVLGLMAGGEELEELELELQGASTGGDSTNRHAGREL
jgi:simple sugar transport system ATP-binding protein